MNWLLILVILIIAANILLGYRRGFLQSAYTLVEWLLIMIFIYWVSPYAADFLAENTSIPEQIEAHCLEQMQESVTSALETDIAENDTGVSADSSLEQLGVKLPAVLLNNLLEENGTYEKLAEAMAELAVQGISYLLTLIVGVIIFHWLRHVFKLIDKIPVLSGINRILGLLAGALKGMLLIWVLFSLIAVFAGTAWGKFAVSYIYESSVLTWLYDNNYLLAVIMAWL